MHGAKHTIPTARIAAVETVTPSSIGRAALAALPAAMLLAFWPASLAAFAPYKALALCVLVTVAATAAAWRPVRVPPSAIIWAWAALGVVLALAAAAGVDPWRSFRGTFPRYESLAALIAATAPVWLAPALLNRRGVGRVLEVTFAATTLVGAYAVVQAVGLDPLHLVMAGRAWGTVGNPVQLGNAMALLAPVPLVIALCGRGTRAMRRLAPFAAAAGVAACVASQTRGAWLGLVTGAVTALLLVGGQIARRRGLIAVAAVAASILLTMVMPAARTVMVERAASLSPTSPSARARLLKWEIGLELVRDRPVLGWGWDAVSEVYPARLPIGWRSLDEEGAVTDRLHSDWLDVTAASGAAGLAAVVALFAVAFEAGRPLLSRTGTAHVLGGGFTGSLVAYLVASLTGFPSLATWPLFWLTAGLFVAAKRGIADKGESEEQCGWQSGRLPFLRAAAIVCGAAAAFGAVWAAQDIAADRSLFAAAMTPGAEQARAYGAAAARFGSDPYVQLRAANGLLSLGRAAGSLPILEEAERIARRAVALRPRDTAALATLADTVLAQGLRGNAAKLAASIPLYENARKAAPYRLDVLKNAGLAAYAQQTTATVTEALDPWRTAAQVDPSDPDSAFDLALAYDFLGRRSEARRWARRAAALAPYRKDAQALLERLAEER